MACYKYVFVVMVTVVVVVESEVNSRGCLLRWEMMIFPTFLHHNKQTPSTSHGEFVRKNPTKKN